jgi:hypothetical protein
LTEKLTGNTSRKRQGGIFQLTTSVRRLNDKELNNIVKRKRLSNWPKKKSNCFQEKYFRVKDS